MMHQLALHCFQGRSGWLAHLLQQLSPRSSGADNFCNARRSADTLALEIMALLLELAVVLHSAAATICIVVLQCVLSCLLQPEGVAARCQGGGGDAAGSMACL